MCSYTHGHPSTRRARRAGREEARLHAGAVTLYRRAAPAAPDHCRERRERREQMAAWPQRREPATCGKVR